MSAPITPATLDAAVSAYWQHRPEQSRPALTEHQRRQRRQRTPVQIWLRRAGA